MKHMTVATVTAMAVAAVLTVVGCSRDPERAKYTVEEYRANKELRQEKVAECTNDPGSLGKTPDCVNALQAERIEGHGSFKERFRPGLNRPKPQENKEGN